MALFTLLTLLPLAILTYAAISLGSDAVTREVRAQVQNSAALEARAVADQMGGIATQAAGFAKRSALLAAFGGSSGGNRDVPALQDEMEQILQSNPGFSSAAVLAAAGRLISIAPPSPSIIGQSFSAEAAAIAAALAARDPGHHVRFAIAKGVWVTADRSLIRAVVQNLLENAWKFTARRDGAVIEFASTAAEDGGICYYVRDNGAGFDPASTEKLFKPFERLHNATEFPGTGIGIGQRGADRRTSRRARLGPRRCRPRRHLLLHPRRRPRRTVTGC